MKKTLLIAAGLLLGFSFAVNAFQDRSPRTFSEAKRVLPNIYEGYMDTFYCGCNVIKKGKFLQVDQASCGYKVRKNENRANRVEWEHVLPASYIYQGRECAKAPGNKRSNCRKTDPVFAMAEGDLHNLVPAIGEVNGDRSHYMFAESSTPNTGMYGQCPVTVNFKEKRVYPKADIKGDIARKFFYMAETYGVSISNKNYQLLKAWHYADPVDMKELTIHDRIAAVTGRSNRYVRAPTGVKEMAKDINIPNVDNLPTAHATYEKGLRDIVGAGKPVYREAVKQAKEWWGRITTKTELED